jgi:hypothetical protein
MSDETPRTSDIDAVVTATFESFESRELGVENAALRAENAALRAENKDLLRLTGLTERSSLDHEGYLDSVFDDHIYTKYLEWVNDRGEEQCPEDDAEQRDEFLDNFHFFAFNSEDGDLPHLPSVGSIGFAQTMLHIAGAVNQYELDNGMEHDQTAYAADPVKYFKMYCYFRGRELINDYDFDGHDFDSYDQEEEEEEEEDIPNPPAPAPPAPPAPPDQGDDDDDDNGGGDGADGGGDDDDDDDGSEEEEEKDDNPSPHPAHPTPPAPPDQGCDDNDDDDDDDFPSDDEYDRQEELLGGPVIHCGGGRWKLDIPNPSPPPAQGCNCDMNTPFMARCFPPSPAMVEKYGEDAIGWFGVSPWFHTCPLRFEMMAYQLNNSPAFFDDEEKWMEACDVCSFSEEDSLLVLAHHKVNPTELTTLDDAIERVQTDPTVGNGEELLRAAKEFRDAHEVLEEFFDALGFDEDDDDDDRLIVCAICLSAVQADEEDQVLPCNHKFHKTCIDDWLKESRSCPICRKSVNDDGDDSGGAGGGAGGGTEGAIHEAWASLPNDLFFQEQSAILSRSVVRKLGTGDRASAYGARLQTMYASIYVAKILNDEPGYTMGDFIAGYGNAVFGGVNDESDDSGGAGGGAAGAGAGGAGGACGSGGAGAGGGDGGGAGGGAGAGGGGAGGGTMREVGTMSAFNRTANSDWIVAANRRLKSDGIWTWVEEGLLMQLRNSIIQVDTAEKRDRIQERFTKKFMDEYCELLVPESDGGAGGAGGGDDDDDGDDEWIDYDISGDGDDEWIDYDISGDGPENGGCPNAVFRHCANTLKYDKFFKKELRELRVICQRNLRSKKKVIEMTAHYAKLYTELLAANNATGYTARKYLDEQATQHDSANARIRRARAEAKVEARKKKKPQKTKPTEEQQEAAEKAELELTELLNKGGKKKNNKKKRNRKKKSKAVGNMVLTPIRDGKLCSFTVSASFGGILQKIERGRIYSSKAEAEAAYDQWVIDMNPPAQAPEEETEEEGEQEETKEEGEEEETKEGGGSTQ